MRSKLNLEKNILKEVMFWFSWKVDAST